MSDDRRDALQVLRYELNFLEQGGYSENVRQGRGISPFQDTLSCLNFGEPTRPHACHECLLYDFVPERFRTEDIPCHFIPLDENKATVCALLKTGDKHALEIALSRWLHTIIVSLEKEAKQLAPVGD